MPQHLYPEDLRNMDRAPRLRLFNALSGFSSPVMVGTLGHRGAANIGLFSSLVHLSVNPPCMGFVIRPLTVPRHTYHNIKAKGYFTVNHAQEDTLQRAHQTSANYPEDISEFDACGLEAEYTERVPAPYVAESGIKLGLQFVEEHLIRINGNIFMVGKVVEIILPEGSFDRDGRIDLAAAGILTVAGLDQYCSAQHLAWLDYARPDTSPGK